MRLAARQSHKDEYLTCAFRCASDSVSRQELRLEVGGYGVPALHVSRQDDKWVANFRLPPGLGTGWQTVRLRTEYSDFGRTLRIAVDYPHTPHAQHVILKGVKDGLSWEADRLTIQDRGYVTCWVVGLPENADRASVEAHLGDVRLPVEFVGEPDEHGCRQVNAMIPITVKRGRQNFWVVCASVSSDDWPILVE